MTTARSMPSLLLTLLMLVACAAPGASVDPVASIDPIATAALPSTAPSPTDAARPESCPVGTPSLSDVIAVPIGDRPDCFGTANLRLRGWVFQEIDPAYDCVMMPQQPGWLSCILSRQQLVADEHAPGPWSEDRPLLWVAADPEGPVGAIAFGAEDGPVAVNTWVEVTGHFADLAAEDCGPPGDLLRIECEGTLVLTDAAVAEPEAPSGAVTAGSFASVTVNGLTVRTEPSTTAPPVECLGAAESVIRVDEGTVVLVLDDRPATDGGHTWHRVVAPADDGALGIGTRCDDIPFVAGWVASSQGADDWLAGDVDCPPAPTTLGRLADLSSDSMRGIACFGSDEIRLTVEFSPPPEGGIGFSCPGVDPAWLTCGIDRVLDGSTTLAVRVPPDVTYEPGVPVPVALHFDDLAATTCRSLADVVDDPAVIDVFCRSQLVVGR